MNIQQDTAMGKKPMPPGYIMEAEMVKRRGKTVKLRRRFACESHTSSWYWKKEGCRKAAWSWYRFHNRPKRKLRQLG